MQPMAMTLVDMIPRQSVLAMLKQAREARPISPLHSCAPSESGAHSERQHEAQQAHLRVCGTN